MPGHLTRKEIKRDEVREALGRGIQYVRGHERLALWTIGGLVAVLLVAALVAFFLSRREAVAAQRLEAALRVYGAEVDVFDAAPDDPEAPRFASDAERLARAKALFQELGDDYGSTSAGEVARVYLGEIAAREGETGTARELWREYLRRSPGTILALSVELNLLALDRDEGKLEQVVAELEKHLEGGRARRSLPEDMVLFELAETLSALGRESEANDTLQRLVDDHPRSPYAFEARQRLQSRPS
ncbi:MAG TPA: tetratricopeptide repeat protein [Thermoanaerobaculia bacterium]|nr:tetratricopeptide repeat protein [Thermoanaerobaculia bacterium]